MSGYVMYFIYCIANLYNAWLSSDYNNDAQAARKGKDGEKFFMPTFNANYVQDRKCFHRQQDNAFLSKNTISLFLSFKSKTQIITVQTVRSEINVVKYLKPGWFDSFTPNKNTYLCV